MCIWKEHYKDWYKWQTTQKIFICLMNAYIPDYIWHLSTELFLSLDDVMTFSTKLMFKIFACLFILFLISFKLFIIDISDTLLKSRNDVICIMIITPSHDLWLEIRGLKLQWDNKCSTRKSIIHYMYIISTNISQKVQDW